jgi:hypothetical protein
MSNPLIRSRPYRRAVAGMNWSGPAAPGARVRVNLRAGLLRHQAEQERLGETGLLVDRRDLIAEEEIVPRTRPRAAVDST